MKKLMKWLLGFYLLFFCGFGYSVCCLNNQGDPVDWWIIVKKPGKIDGNDAIYIDPKLDNPDYISFGKKHGDNPLFRTLKQSNHLNTPFRKEDKIHFCEPNNLCTLVYNDQEPKEADAISKYSHSKGIVSFDNQEGFWIIHSLPRFPDVDEKMKSIKFSLPNNVTNAGHGKAQSLFCMSLPRENDGIDQFSKITEHLSTLKVNFYPRVESNFYSGNAVKQQKKCIRPTLELKLLGGSEVVSYGIKNCHNTKTDRNKLDIYEYIARLTNHNLMVQSWSDKLLESKRIYPVKQLSFPNNRSNPWGDKIAQKKDHSKWAISKNKGTLVCMGDLNREESQKSRGGQMCCIESKQAWNMFHSMIYTLEQRDAIKVLAQESGLSKNKLTKVKKIKECTLKELIKMGDIVVCKEGQKHAYYLKEHKPNPCADV